MTTLDLPRSHVCAVCVGPISDERFETGAWCCSRRCERVHDRIKAAKAAGDTEKLARADAAGKSILRESLTEAAARVHPSS